ncbi:protein C19orf12 homolog isoform X3 [Saccopteryx leptura]|uniref:protein C19orf12 homolog isoform X3 n=1 Tax=Saccopteryx leptura TaxID=249018 RepID=UPI00339C0603
MSVMKPAKESTTKCRRKCVSVEDVINLLCDIAGETEMKAALKKRRRALVVAVVPVLIGAAIGNPIAVFAGVLTGGALWKHELQRHFEPVAQLLKALPDVQQQNLFNKVRAIIEDLDSMDAYQLRKLVRGREDLYEELVQMLQRYFSEERNAKVECRTRPSGQRSSKN